METVDKRIDILHINSYYSTSKFYKNIFDYQTKNYNLIDVFIPVKKGYKPILEDFGSYSTLIESFSNFHRVFYRYKQRKILKQAELSYDFNSYSLLHAHSLFTNGFIAYKVFKKTGVPYVVAVRNTDINLFFKRRKDLRKIGINILKSANKIIFISENHKNETFEKYIPSNIHKLLLERTEVIPNGVETFWLNNKDQSVKKYEDKFLYVGLINQNKNLKLTLDSLDLLYSKNKKIVFTVVGKIIDKSLGDRIKNTEYCRYLGSKNKEELLTIYRQHCIFIMPSFLETFGITYLEAMSQGVPLIYTKGQGFDSEYSNKFIGCSIDPTSVDELIEAISYIKKNYHSLSKNCIESIDYYDWNKINNIYTDIYHKIIENKKEVLNA